MSPASQERGQAIARCHGYTVVASDGPLGEVETPIFPPHADEPDYLIVRVARPRRDRRPVVPTALVERVDQKRRVIRVQGSKKELSHLPEYLPLAGRGRSKTRGARGSTSMQQRK